MDRIDDGELTRRIIIALNLMRGKHRPAEASHVPIADAVARHLRQSGAFFQSSPALDFGGMQPLSAGKAAAADPSGESQTLPEPSRS